MPGSVGSMAQAIDAFFAKRLGDQAGCRHLKPEQQPVGAAEALVWPQRRPYKKLPRGSCRIDQIALAADYYGSARTGTSLARDVTLRTNAGYRGAGLERNFDNALAGAVHWVSCSPPEPSCSWSASPARRA